MIIHLVLTRCLYTPHSTRGVLLKDGVFLCYTLEDAVRETGMPKVPGLTAIAAGLYRVIVNMSTRFKRLMCLLLNVPDFSGIRMHGGNTPGDTEGCILVAKSAQAVDVVSGSFESNVTAIVQAEIAQGNEVWIQIVDTYPNVGQTKDHS